MRSRQLPLPRLALIALAMFPQVSLAATLTGRITGPTGAGVYPLDIDVRDSNTGVLLVTPGDTTTTNGNFTLTVPAGKYDITFVPTPASHLFREVRKGINVTTTTTINRTLALGRYVTGRVVDGSGAGVPNTNVDFHSPTTGDAAGNFQDDQTDANGDFNALVDPGVWDVEFIAPTAAHLVPGRFMAVGLTVDQNVGTITLQPGHVVVASVTDLGLFPIASADLDAIRSVDGEKLWTPQDNTDATGSATLVLPAGTYDFVATPPPGQPYATRATRAVGIFQDTVLGNFDLPNGLTLTAHCQSATAVPIPGVDADIDSLPSMHRLVTPGDQSQANGQLTTLVAPWKYRITFSPTVASKYLPVRLDSVQVGGNTNLGNIVFAQGHWVSVTAVEQGSGTPIPGVNLDFVNAATNQLAITPGDVTDATGFARVTTDAGLYRLRLRPPGTDWVEVELPLFRTLGDTVLVVALPRATTGVGTPIVSGLSLSSPWPNPSRGPLTVRYTTPSTREVSLEVWDVNGRRVATIARSAEPGTHQVSWDAAGVKGSPRKVGVYWLRLTDGTTALTQRFVVLD